MKNTKLIVLIFFIIMISSISIKVLSLIFSKPALTAPDAVENQQEKRGTPPYDLVIDKEDILPHIRVYFWLPDSSTYYKAFSDTGIKTYVFGHGTIDKWSVMESWKKANGKKLVYVYVPKTFALYYGKQFYNLVHIYYK